MSALRPSRGRRSIVAALVVLATLGAAVAWASTDGRAASVQAGPDAMNVVVVVTDDQRFDELDAMPYLASRPAGEWVSFTNAVTTTPLCCPSRASMLTGQYAKDTGVVDNGTAGELDESSTVAAWLDDAGYRTGLVGKYLNNWWLDHGETRIPQGWDRFNAFIGEGGTYVDYRMNLDGRVRSYGNAAADYSTDVVKGLALKFLKDPDPAPFLLWVAPSAPHGPVVVAPRHRTSAVSVPPPGPGFDEVDVSDKPSHIRARPRLTAEQVTAQRTRQVDARRSLLAVDEMVRALVGSLTASGELERTAIVVVSDNGLAYGAHRLRSKSCAYQECIRTPLMVRWPGAVNGDDGHLVAGIDLAPTLMDAAGLPVPAGLAGQSLRPLLEGEEGSWRSALLIEDRPRRVAENLPPFSAVLTDRWKYVEYDNGGRELYDLTVDPYELISLHKDPARAAKRAELDALLDQLRG